MKKILIVDGNSILNRAFYGVRPLTTKDGLHTNAVYGMLNILLKHLDALKPDVLAAAFDLREPTFRHTQYAEYKAGRKGMPDELAMQLPFAKDCLSAMGFHVLSLSGYEADDILGTLAVDAADAEMQAILLTGDRDALQLIGDRVTVLLAKNQDTVVFNREHFIETYGITPEEFVDVKALMGDSSDNIPGVPGIGEKTALKLISTYHSLEGLYEALERGEISGAVKTKLTAGADSAMLSRRLAKIDCNVPLAQKARELEELKPDRARLRELFIRMEFSQLMKRMHLSEEETEKGHDNTAMLTFEESILPADSLKSLPAGPLALHMQLAEEVCLYLSDGRKVWICKTPPSELLSAFLSDKDRFFIVHDAKAWYTELAKIGISPADAGFDTMLAAYVLNPTDSAYGLERLCMQYLGVDRREGEAWTSAAVYALYESMRQRISDTGMDFLFTKIEMPLARVLFQMESCGFRVDTDGLKRFGEELGSLGSEYADRIYNAAGMTFNIQSPKQLGEVLFEKIGLPPLAKTKTGYSTNAEVLERLRPYHPIISDILEYRQVMKLKSTYADGLWKAADSAGRVHTSFHQTITATGRLSSTEPNLQNIPIRQDLGRELRKFFIAENEDYLLLDADYSQIELRLLAAISGDETMIKAFRDEVDIHAVTASQVFGVPLKAVTPEMRKKAKAVNFGIVYGIGDYSLSIDIGVTRREAAEYIRQYLEKYPAVSAYLQDIVRRAKEDGYVTTLFGRRRYIPELKATKKQTVSFGERVAMNSPIQGSAADIIKLAMVNLTRRLAEGGYDARLILQVHDELIVECHRTCAQEVMRLMKEEMENTIQLPVPLTVDLSSGATWYDGH